MEFPTNKFKLKRDRYAKTRGASHLLFIACGKCDEPFMIYQKDGPGSLLRCYSDRIVWPEELVKKQIGLSALNVKKAGALTCAACGNIMAVPIVYEKESRPAYRIFAGGMRVYRKRPEVDSEQSD